MIKLFSNIRPEKLIFLFLFTFAIRAFFFFNITPDLSVPTITFYFYSVFNTINTSHILQFTISTFLVFSTALILNRIVVNHEILFKSNYLSAYFFILFTSLFPEQFRVGPILFFNLLLVLSMNELFHLYKTNRPVDSIFIASLLAGMCPLFDLRYLAMLLFLLLAITFFRTFNIREYLAAIVGFLMPLYVGFMVNFLLYNKIIPGHLSFPSYVTYENAYWMLRSPLIPILAIGIIAGLRLANNFSKNNIKTRKIHQLIIVYLLLIILITQNTQLHPKNEISLVMIPGAILFGHYFTSENKIKFFKEIIHYILLAYIIACQYFLFH